MCFELAIITKHRLRQYHIRTTRENQEPALKLYSANCNVFVLEHSRFSEHSGQQDIRYGIEHPI